MGNFMERGWGKEIISKRKERIIWGQVISFLREGNFYHTDILFFLWGMEKAPMAGYVIGVNQKIQLLIKITFQRQVKTAVRLGIKSRLGIIDLSMNDVICGPWFFPLTVP